MLSLFKKKQDPQVLLFDFGSDSVKVALFEPTTRTLQKVIKRPLPSDAFVDLIVSPEGSLPGLIASLAAEMDAVDCQIASGISGKKVIAKKIDVPNKITDAVIPEFIKVEAEQEIFFNKTEMDLDYELLEGVNFNEVGGRSLYVVVVEKKVIQNYNTCFQEAGLSLEVLDPNFSATFNSLLYNEDLEKDKNYMLLDIGKKYTDLVISVNNQLIFSRSLPQGGDFYNEKIEQDLGVEADKVEELKLESTYEDGAAQVSEIIKGSHSAFIEEIQSCYEIYLSLFPSQKISKLFLSGGGSQTLGLDKAIGESLQIPCEKFNPFKNMNCSEELEMQQDNLKAYAAVVSGLALRFMDND